MNDIQRQKLFQYALPLAVASGLFVLMLAGLLAFNEVRGKVTTLVNSKQVVRLHDELRSRPKDEALKEKIRLLNLELRQETFTGCNSHTKRAGRCWAGWWCFWRARISCGHSAGGCRTRRRGARASRKMRNARQ